MKDNTQLTHGLYKVRPLNQLSGSDPKPVVPTFRDSQEAFADAIKAGRLSENHDDSNFAANYMYMGTISGSIGFEDQFKNIDTRRYDV